jgi:hypothetical protein
MTVKQTIHIFKKDVRSLRGEISITLLVVLIFMFFSGADFGGLLLTLVWWILTARVIQSEPLVGDRHFWSTRPYEWRRLMAAKGLFLLTFVTLPMTTADLFILHRYGFSLMHEIPGLVWNQFLIFACIILPIAALAAVTNGLAQVLSATFVLILGVILCSGGISGIFSSGSWGPIDWIRISAVVILAIAGTAAALLCQYSRKKTLRSGLLLAGAFVAMVFAYRLIPWSAAFELQCKLSKQAIDPSNFQPAFDLKEKAWMARSSPTANGQVQIELPIAVRAVPTTLSYKPDGLIVTIQAPGGDTWRSSGDPSQQLSSSADIASLQTNLDPAFYEKIKDQPVKIQATLYLTILGGSTDTSVPIQSGVFPVDKAGVCTASKTDLGFQRSGMVPNGVEVPQGPRQYSYMLTCHLAFRPTAGDIMTFSNGFTRDTFVEPASYSPFPARLTFNPVSQYFSTVVSTSQLTGVNVTTNQPVAFIRRDFYITGVRLSDFDLEHQLRLRLQQKANGTRNNP